MVSRSVSCSWCHATNVLDDPTARHCVECGHRIDLPRSECDCPKCRATPDERRKLARRDMGELLGRLDAAGGDLGKVLDQKPDQEERP